MYAPCVQGPHRLARDADPRAEDLADARACVALGRPEDVEQDSEPARRLRPQECDVPLRLRVLLRGCGDVRIDHDAKCAEHCGPQVRLTVQKLAEELRKLGRECLQKWSALLHA
jgi:hypothetical protein